jgi:hypothetical protein
VFRTTIWPTKRHLLRLHQQRKRVVLEKGLHGTSWNTSLLQRPPKKVFINSALGDQMKKCSLHSKVRANYIGCAPEIACSTDDVGPLDKSRWHARTARGLGKELKKLRRACGIFDSAVVVVTNADITGIPDDAQIHRCAVACYNAKKNGGGFATRVRHLTQICRDAHYDIGPEFLYVAAYNQLKSSSLLDSSSDAFLGSSNNNADECGPEGKECDPLASAEIATAVGARDDNNVLAETDNNPTLRPEGVLSAKEMKRRSKREGVMEVMVMEMRLLP